jgi:hypothetical protein
MSCEQHEILHDALVQYYDTNYEDLGGFAGTWGSEGGTWQGWSGVAVVWNDVCWVATWEHYTEPPEGSIILAASEVTQIFDCNGMIIPPQLWLADGVTPKHNICYCCCCWQSWKRCNIFEGTEEDHPLFVYIKCSDDNIPYDDPNWPTVYTGDNFCYPSFRWEGACYSRWHAGGAIILDPDNLNPNYPIVSPTQWCLCDQNSGILDRCDVCCEQPGPYFYNLIGCNCPEDSDRVSGTETHYYIPVDAATSNPCVGTIGVNGNTSAACYRVDFTNQIDYDDLPDDADIIQGFNCQFDSCDTCCGECEFCRELHKHLCGNECPERYAVTISGLSYPPGEVGDTYGQPCNICSTINFTAERQGPIHCEWVDENWGSNPWGGGTHIVEVLCNGVCITELWWLRVRCRTITPGTLCPVSQHVWELEFSARGGELDPDLINIPGICQGTNPPTNCYCHSGCGEIHVLMHQAGDCTCPPLNWSINDACYTDNIDPGTSNISITFTPIS